MRHIKNKNYIHTDDYFNKPQVVIDIYRLITTTFGNIQPLLKFDDIKKLAFITFNGKSNNPFTNPLIRITRASS